MQSSLTPHAVRVSPDWVVASSPPPPHRSQHPLPWGPGWGPAEHSSSGLHCSPQLISGSDSGWRRAPQSGGPGRVGPAADRRRGYRSLSSFPRAPPESGGRGGSRAAHWAGRGRCPQVALREGAGPGAGRDPLPRKPRGRSASAVRESGQVWLRRARLRVLRLGRRRGAVPSRVGLGPLDPGAQSRFRPLGGTFGRPSSPGSRGPGRAGAGQ